MYKSNFETYKSKLYLYLSPQSRNVGSERWQIRNTEQRTASIVKAILNKFCKVAIVEGIRLYQTSCKAYT